MIVVMDVNSISIEGANEPDIPGILALIEDVHIKNLTSLDNGFLMIPNASADLYKKWFKDSPYCYVARGAGKVVGVLIVLPLSSLGDEICLHKHVREKFGLVGTVYTAQIAVKPMYRKKGVGRLMYSRLFEDVRGLLLIASSMKKPYNKASEAFHLKVGYTKVETFGCKDGTEAFIYCKDQRTG